MSKDNTLNLEEPILIYQMGKVASMSIFNSLKEEGFSNVHHVHKLENCNKEIRSLKKIITLAREPVARNISAFFENLTIYSEDNPSGNIQIMIDSFLNNYPHNRPINWFDKEFKKNTGIDIYNYPFNKEAAFSIIKDFGYEILILKVETTNAQKEKILEAFLGKEITIENSNTAESKHYKDTYTSFKKAITLPLTYSNNLYNSKYMNYFYIEEEIALFKKRWKHDEKK